MFYCENCGTKLTADAHFCENCGYQVPLEEPIKDDASNACVGDANFAIFESKNWKNDLKKQTTEKRSGEIGIILTNTADVAISARSNIKIKLAKYISYCRQKGTRYFGPIQTAIAMMENGKMTKRTATASTSTQTADAGKVNGKTAKKQRTGGGSDLRFA